MIWPGNLLAQLGWDQPLHYPSCRAVSIIPSVAEQNAVCDMYSIK